MEVITPGQAPEVPDFDCFAWPLCADLSRGGNCWIAPQIPHPVLAAALTTFLDLAEDETLLAILGGGTEQAPVPSCALTTKRVYWSGEPRRAAGKRADPNRPAPTSDSVLNLRCEYLDYKDLPETIALTGVFSKVVDLGEGREIKLGTRARPLKALVAFLTEVRARVLGEKPVPELVPAVRDQARWAWPAMVAADAEAKAFQGEMRKFRGRTTAAARAVVTPLLAAVCVLVYVLMVVRGVSPVEPANDAMLEWGANFGPSVVFDGQVWRLGSSMFLHFGLFHLAMNLWCLMTTGPVVEKFFGHLGFAALYVLSGLGGAIASLFFHPTFICAGASGAIFGVIGGLLGFLAVRHRDVPAAILRPMRSGTLAFVGYNILFGLSQPSIDMAGHLGGLATGFLAGLLLAGDGLTRGDWVGLLRRAGMIAALSVGLGLLAQQVIGLARGRILADPKMGPVITTRVNAAPAWNEFSVAIKPVIEEFDRNERAIQRLLDDLDRGVPTQQAEPALDLLISDSESLSRDVAALPAGNEEIRAMAGKLADARKHQARALAVVKQYLPDRNETVLVGPDGLKASFDAYVKDFQEFAALRDAYFKSHGLVQKTP